jgi:Beta-galactosidase trimerisation domain
MNRQATHQINAEHFTKHGTELHTAHETWEGMPYPDMPQVVQLLPGEAASACFEIGGGLAGCDLLSLRLLGYPGTCIGDTKTVRDTYFACTSILIDLEISINGETLFSGPVYLRSHPQCGIGQETQIDFPRPHGLVIGGKNTIRIRNITDDRVPSGKTDYYLISVEIAAASGKLVNDCYQPDSLDHWLSQQPESDDLFCGVGYELIPNRHIPAMIRAVRDDHIGNYILFRLDAALNDGCLATPEELIRWARLCAENKIHFSFLAFRAPKHSFDAETAVAIADAGGEYFFSVNLHELGLIVDGRKEWVEPFHQGPVETLRHGWDIYQRAVRACIQDDLSEIPRPVVCSVARHVSGYNLRNLVDYTVAEIPNVGFTTVFSARGATQCCGRNRWGVHIASLWVLSNSPAYPPDRTYVNRNVLLAKLCYMLGARLIYPESGLFNLIPASVIGKSRKCMEENRLQPDSVVQKGVRQAFRSVSRLHALHRLPSEPVVHMAFMQGHLDPFCGTIRNGTAFRTPGLNAIFADRGWEIMELMLPRILIRGSHRTANLRQWMSGSPFGQFDIIPDFAGPDRMQSYPIVFIPGWNTMTEEAHERWKSYVDAGGTLVVSAMQLRTDDRHTAIPRFFRDGDLNELFGVELGGIGDELICCEHVGHLAGSAKRFTFCERNRLYADLDQSVSPMGMRTHVTDAEIVYKDSETGAPILTRKAYGRGEVYLFTTWEYPGHPCVFPLVREFLSGLLDAKRPDVFVEAGDETHWIHFRGDVADTVAILNTDWRESVESTCATLHAWGASASLQINPLSVRIVHLDKHLWVSPRSEDCAARIMSSSTEGATLAITGSGAEQIEIFAGFPIEVEIDSCTIPVRRDGRMSVFELSLGGSAVASIRFLPSD